MREQLTQLLEEYHIVGNLGPVLIVIGITMILIFALSTILDIYSFRRKEEKYLSNFQTNYFNSHNIKITMVNTRTQYRDKEKEAKALDAGLYYLDHSLLRDYKGAVSYIEHLFHSKKIEELHEQCIKDAQSQKQLLLTKLEESGEHEACGNSND